MCGGLDSGLWTLDSGGLGIMSFWQSASRDSEGGGVVFLYISNKINEIFFCCRLKIIKGDIGHKKNQCVCV